MKFIIKLRIKDRRIQKGADLRVKRVCPFYKG